MPKFPQPIAQLITQLGLLPGVGPKTAERYAFALLKKPKHAREQLAQAILAPDMSLVTCARCKNYAESDPCGICADPARKNAPSVCVVATEQDLLAIEQTGEYRGLYHILGGTLSPADGIGPDDLTIRDLVARIASEKPTEIILALDPTIEGEATMLYVSRLLLPSGARITRLAKGLPSGSELTYADEVTLSDALRGRRDMPNQSVKASFDHPGRSGAEIRDLTA